MLKNNVSLAEAAKLITQMSGHYIDRGTIYQQLRHKKSWTLGYGRTESGDYRLPLADVKHFAKTFKGKAAPGRPRKQP